MIGFADRTNIQCTAGIPGRAAETVTSQTCSRVARKITRVLLSLVVVLLSAAPALAVSEQINVDCYAAGLNFEQTITSCTRIIDDKRMPEKERYVAYLTRARAYYSMQEWNRSIGDYDSATQLFPHVAEAFNERGAVYDRIGNRERAISDYSAAIKINPSNSRAYGNRGLSYYNNGAYDLAIADFDEAIRLDAKYSIAYNRRGVAHSKKGEQEKAIADFTEAIRLDRFYAKAYSNRAIARANIGKFDQAISDLSVAIRLEDNPNFYNDLAWTYFRAGQAKAGLPYANHALRVKPDYANAYDTRGSIYEALGEHGRAVADFEKALSLDPSIGNSAAALKRLAQTDSASVTFFDVVQFVEKHGWRINLGDMCAKFELPQHEGNGCFFKQLSVQETEGRSDPRGLNVSVSPNSGPPYILIFHLNPLVGEFFVISPNGTLLRAFVRFKGADYKRISNEEVREEFNKDIAYWTGNFVRLKNALEAERSEKNEPGSR